METKHKVLLRRCHDYNPDVIGGIIKEGMEELGVKPYGRVLLKPNVVVAHREFFPNAFTRKEFLDGVLQATTAMAESEATISVGERSGITMPTRWTFKEAGYPAIIKKHGVRTFYFDEEKQLPVRLKNPEALRKQVFIPKPITETDFLINLPKFKAHPWCRLTLSLKNYIGIQDDRHRLVDHNQFLNHKIADLQEVIPSKFIAVDAIIAGEKTMLTPNPYPMGVIVMGVNPCAVDTVGCHMVNLEPENLVHLKFASERGFGPMNLDEIEVVGDYPLEELRDKNVKFRFCFERIDKYFSNGSNLQCVVGDFPEKHSRDYCWGGCPGALQEAINMIKVTQPDVLTEMRKVRYVVGEIKEDLNISENEKVLFAGDCTSFEGKINGEFVKIEKNYKTSSNVDETKTHSFDMLKKNFNALKNINKSRDKKYLHAAGCPVFIGDHIHYLSALGGFKNLNFDKRFSIPATIDYVKMRFNRLLNSFK